MNSYNPENATFEFEGETHYLYIGQQGGNFLTVAELLLKHKKGELSLQQAIDFLHYNFILSERY